MLHIPHLDEISDYTGDYPQRLTLDEFTDLLRLVMAFEPEFAKPSTVVQVMGIGEDGDPECRKLLLEKVLPAELAPHAVAVAGLLNNNVAEGAISLQAGVLSSAWRVDGLSVHHQDHRAGWAGSIFLDGQPTKDGRSNLRSDSGFASKALCHLALICTALQDFDPGDDDRSLKGVEEALLAYHDGGDYQVALDALPRPLVPLRSGVEGVMAEETFESAVILFDKALVGNWHMHLERAPGSRHWVCWLVNTDAPAGRRVSSPPSPESWIAVTMAVLEARLLEIKMPSESAA